MKTFNGMSLYTRDGRRKYLNAVERTQFLNAASKSDGRTQALCFTLTYTGCRISEALGMSPASIQPDPGVISIRSLKKREQLHIREVPVPRVLIAVLDTVYGAGGLLLSGSISPDDRLWTWGRTTAWSRVKQVMNDAGIYGPHASPKALRHSFGVHAIQSGIPLNLVQKWLGHANMATTAIYTNAVGPEEIAIAGRMW